MDSSNNRYPLSSFKTATSSLITIPPDETLVAITPFTNSSDELSSYALDIERNSSSSPITITNAYNTTRYILIQSNGFIYFQDQELNNVFYMRDTQSDTNESDSSSPTGFYPASKFTFDFNLI